MPVAEYVDTPAPPPPPAERRPGQRAVWVVLGIMALVLLAVFLLVGMLVAGTAVMRTSDDAAIEASSFESAADADAGAPAETTSADGAPVEAASSDAPDNPDAPVAPAGIDPNYLLVEFGQAWEAGDWERMETLATANVVEVAREWYIEGGTASLTEGDPAMVADHCRVLSGGTGCTFLYSGEGGPGLIFNLAYSLDEADGIITELTFGGDAG